MCLSEEPLCQLQLGGKLRPLARSARYLPDRLLHGWRRWSTLRRLSRRPQPRTVLFICYGNICRSPYAAALARTLFPAEVAVESAGFIGPDRPSPGEAVVAAGERGIDLSAHRSQLVTPVHLQAADLVLVMDRAQHDRIARARPALAGRTVLLGDLDPDPIARRAIPDPVDQPIEVFRSCYARIGRCVRVLASLRNERAGRDSRS